MEISDLSHRGSLQVNAWVDDAHGGNSTHSNNYSRAFSVHEQVIVNIEILSDTWFTKGTHIHRFEVDNAVVLSNQLHSINSTKRINGKTYSQQIWEVVVYPLQSGEFLIPSITIELEIKNISGSSGKNAHENKNNKEKNSNVSGFIQTEPIRFSANKQSAFMFEPHLWLTADNVDVSQQITVVSSSEDREQLHINVGDSITRTITLTASNTNSMLLPELVNCDDFPYTTDYVKCFVQSSQINETRIRGVNKTTKVEAITYVVKEAGEFTLPEVVLFVWEPENQEIKSLKLDSANYRIKYTLGSWIKAYLHELLVAVACVLLILIMMKKLVVYYSSRKSPLLFRFLLSLVKKEVVDSENIVYERFLTKYGQYRLFTQGKELDDTSIHRRYKKLSKVTLFNSRYLINLWCRITR